MGVYTNGVMKYGANSYRVIVPEGVEVKGRRGMNRPVYLDVKQTCASR